MIRINKALKNKYINGEDLGNINIDELEDNREFMLEVIKQTHDPKMILLCSDKLQSDYLFAEGIMHIFKDNMDFIYKYLKDFLANTSDDFVTRELICFGAELEMAKDDDCYQEFRMLMAADYLQEKIGIENTYLSDSTGDLRIEYGLGFGLIQIAYASSKIIIKYFAQKFINEIFYNNDNIPFNEIVYQITAPDHDRTKTNLNKAIIEYINKFDKYLANYAIANPTILDTLKASIHRCLQARSTYNANLLKQKILLINEEAMHLMATYSDHQTINFYAILDNLVEEFGLAEYFHDDYTNPLAPEYINPADRVAALAFKKHLREFIKSTLAVESFSQLINTDDYYIKEEVPKKVILFP